MLVKKEDPIYCPVNGWDCPYWTEGGVCTLENVAMECDDYMAFDYDFEYDNFMAFAHDYDYD